MGSGVGTTKGDTTMPTTPQRQSQRGAGLVVVILLILVSLALTGALVTLISSTTAQSRSARLREASYSIAEAGINQAVFQVEALMGTPGNIKDLEAYLTIELGPGHTGTKTFTGTLANGNYTVTMSDPLPGDNAFQLDAVAQVPNASPRNVTAIVHSQPVTALSYALFGNYIHFDNHNGVNFGVRLVTSIYTNSGMLIDKGVSINGPVQAVQFIAPNSGPGSGNAMLADTVLSPTGQQGDPNPSPVVATAPVMQVDPAPKIQPFPSFDFGGVANDATAAGRNLTALQLTELLNNARAFALTLVGGNLNTPIPLLPASYPAGVSPANVPVSVIHHSSPVVSNHRKVRVPDADNPGLAVDVGSPDGVAQGPNDTYEIILEGNPLPDNDSVLYVIDPLAITLPTDTLMRLEGSIIVNGQFTLHAASEILAWENRSAPYFVPLGSTLYDFAQNMVDVANPNKDIRYSRYPAIAANGPIKIDKSGAGMGGPTHIEGVVYSVAESHLHRSEARERAYSVGSEIADTVHNCEFFSFAYDPEARNVLGLYIRLSGRPRLQIVRLEDR